MAVLLANLFVARAGARPQAAQYVTAVWQTEQGLPQNSVTAMVQDHEGYLWIGTFGGLARFDGERFTVFSSADNPGFGSDRILSLHETRSGALWIGTVDGGLTRLQDGVAKTFTDRDGLPTGSVSSIGEDAEGNIWVNTSGGLALLAGSRLQRYATHQGKSVREFYLQARDGSMWFRSGQDVVRFGADGTTATLHVLKPTVFYLHEGRDGSVWVACREQYRLVRYKGGTFSDVRLPPLGPRAVYAGRGILAMAEDPDGQLVLLTPAGLLRVVDGKAGPLEPTFFPRTGTELPQVRSLVVDLEGDRWVGTIGSGLIRFRRAPLTALGKEEGLSDASFSAVFQDRLGRLWLGGDSLYWFDGNHFHLVPHLRNIRAIDQTRDGDLWFGGYGGLYRWRSGVLKFYKVEAPAVRAIYQDREGTVWIGAILEDRPGGLYRFKQGIFEQISGISDVRSIIEDPDGSLWVGGLQGLWHIRAAQVVLYDRKQGLPTTAIYDLYQEPTGILWLATYGGGLIRFRDGQFKAITTREGLPNNMPLYMLEDGKGNLWVSSNQDIFRLGLKELDDFVEGRISSLLPISYGVAEGMRSSECNGGNPAGWRTPDGRLWFPTLRGVVTIDPNAGNRIPPPVFVEQAWTDKVTLGTTGRNSIPPGSNTLDFRYTALSFSAPQKLRFKYRLEPYEKDWVDAGTRRAAHYTNMPPGKYSFRVVAANSYGIWSDHGASVDFVLQPHFYQTYWFAAVCVGAVLVLFWVAYQRRVHQLHREFEMTLDARVGERTRIARELHDTLLQSFQGILLHLQRLSNRLQPGETKQALDGTIEHAAQAIVEGREAVQGLRASTVEANDLALALRTLGEELAGENPSRRPGFGVRLEGTPQNLHPILRDEVYRVAGEAIRNAFRHADAQHIEVEIRYDERQLRLRVRDDGRGIDPKLLRADGRRGHFGLHGMRERAKSSGGTLTLWSELDSGTEVELNIPADRAYKAASGKDGSFFDILLSKFRGRRMRGQ